MSRRSQIYATVFLLCLVHTSARATETLATDQQLLNVPAAAPSGTDNRTPVTANSDNDNPTPTTTNSDGDDPTPTTANSDGEDPTTATANSDGEDATPLTAQSDTDNATSVSESSETDPAASVAAHSGAAKITLAPSPQAPAEVVIDTAAVMQEQQHLEAMPLPAGAVILPDAGLESIQVEPFEVLQESTQAAPDTGSTSGSWGPLSILGAEVKPGSRAELYWSAGQSFSGSAIQTPVVVLRGRKPGPTLCLTAAVHGDELNGVEIVRRVLADLDIDDELVGTVIGVPIVNLLGFSRGSRYLPDRRDLNRYFPGHPDGSSASRIAHVFFTQVIAHCHRLVDLHTGSFKRTNLPQLRANLNVPAVREFVERFGATAVLHKAGARGTLRNAATSAGIPAVAFELGEPGTLQLDQVSFGIKAIDTLLDKLDMVDRFRLWSEPQPIYYRSTWLRAYRGGILISAMRVGTRVESGDMLGLVTNPLTNEQSKILSPYSGRLLGRALNQFVLPGFATFHIGIETADDLPATLLLGQDGGEGVDDASADESAGGNGSDGEDFDEENVDEETH